MKSDKDIPREKITQSEFDVVRLTIKCDRCSARPISGGYELDILDKNKKALRKFLVTKG